MNMNLDQLHLPQRQRICTNLRANPTVARPGQQTSIELALGSVFAAAEDLANRTRGRRISKKNANVCNRDFPHCQSEREQV